MKGLAASGLPQTAELRDNTPSTLPPIPSRRPPRGTIRLHLLAVLVIASACATTAPPTTARFAAFPSPLEGPGRSELKRHETERIHKGWQALTRGNPAAASAEARRAGPSPEARLLGMQAELEAATTPEVIEGLTDLASGRPGYASAWITLSVAAERAGNEGTALTAARQGAELWPSGPFADRPRTLEKQWVDDRLAQAELDIGSGNPQAALGRLNLVLNLEPESEPALLTQARALIALGDVQQAESSLARLGDQPEALMLRAQIAYAQQQWRQAMDLLSRVPESYPERQASLQRARLWWRLSILPPHVQQAVDSKAVTREQLAVLLVALTPALETLPGGNTPLMQDVLRLPSQRSILTVTRLGIMASDSIDGQFHPDRLVSPGVARDAIDAVCHLVGFSAPIWCAPDEATRKGCTLLQEPLTGRSVTEVVLTAAVEESEG